MLDVVVENTGGVGRKLLVTVDAEQITKKTDAKLKQMAKSVKVDGFRPGKVPLDIIKQRYGVARLREESAQQIVEAGIEEIIGKHKLQPMEQLTLEGFTDTPDSGMQCSLSLEVRPEITICDFATIQIEEPKLEITTKEATNYITFLRRRYGKKNEVERATQYGDEIVADVVKTIEPLALAAHYSLYVIKKLDLANLDKQTIDVLPERTVILTSDAKAFLWEGSHIGRDTTGEINSIAIEADLSKIDTSVATLTKAVGDKDSINSVIVEVIEKSKKHITSGDDKTIYLDDENKQLQGKKIGEQVVYSDSLKDEELNTELPYTLDVKIHEIFEVQLAELNKEFAEKIKIDSEQLDKLEDTAKERLAGELAELKQQYVKRQITQQLVEKCTISADPEAFVAKRVAQAIGRKGEAKVLPYERQYCDATTRHYVRLNLLMEEICKKHDIKLSKQQEETIRVMNENINDSSNKDKEARQYYQYMAMNMANNFIEQRIFEFIKSKATTKVCSMSSAELHKRDQKLQSQEY